MTIDNIRGRKRAKERSRERSHDKRQRGVVAMAVTERDGANQRVRDGGGGGCVCMCAGWRVVVGEMEGGEWWEVGGGGGGRRRERWGRRRVRGGEVRVAAAAVVCQHTSVPVVLSRCLRLGLLTSLRELRHCKGKKAIRITSAHFIH